ncbi:IS3 family transposase [Streptomyces levis]|uniref:IS3 family transposase n=1 Tax=Streptomyces levis TaxID=285566 RepID=UPI003C7C4879
MLLGVVLVLVGENGARCWQVHRYDVGRSFDGRFFGLLKAEIGTTVWESHEQARADVFHFIDVEYNRTRLRKHPVYGYVTPLETRALTAQTLAPAA